MKCSLCKRRNRMPGLEHCRVCSIRVAPIYLALVNAARNVVDVADAASYDSLSQAERQAEHIHVKWDAAEAARAIKRSMGGLTEAVVHLAGARDFTSADLESIGQRVGMHVCHGTEFDTLIVVGGDGD